jgi:5-oxoprolinase (ATP-hydrolysing)
VLSRYADRIAQALGSGNDGPRLFFIPSNGGLAAPDYFHSKDAVLSGPAGGVIGMAESAH